MWFTRDDQGFRGWFTVDLMGEVRTGLLAGDFLVTVVNPSDGASTNPSVTESSQKPGLYRFDVPSLFLTTHGPGSYAVVIQVDTITGPSPPPEVLAVLDGVLHVNEEDFDSLPTAAEVAAAVAAPTVAQIADAVWDESASSHSTAGSMGAKANLIELLRKVATNRVEESPGNPGKLIVYDDDGTTKILEFNLLDNSDGAIVPTVGTPAKRSENIL